MTRTKILARYIQDHEDLTIAEIGFIKEALIFYEALYGKDFDEDVELEINTAIELYINHLNNESTNSE